MQTFERVKQSIATAQFEMLENTIKWANISSHSEDMHGLSVLAENLYDAFSQMSDDAHKISLPEYQGFNLNGEKQNIKLGEMLVFTKRKDAAIKILLCGHYDTVFKEKDFFKVEQKEADILQGLGVTDMKGGLAIMLGALTALEQVNAIPNIGWQVLLTPDEEIGSPGSSTLFEQFVKNKRCGFIFEPSLDDKGTFAGNRKASRQYTLIMEGIAAHAGRSFAEGNSAIAAMASAITQMHKLNDIHEDVTVNVGLVQGGSAVNVVAKDCVAKILVRSISNSSIEEIETAINNIAIKVGKHANVKVSVRNNTKRPAKILNDENIKLFEFVNGCAKSLNLNYVTKNTGGVCDGNNMHALGLPVVDTMGAIGGKIHSTQEYLYIPSLKERAELLAKILVEFELLRFTHNDDT